MTEVGAIELVGGIDVEVAVGIGVSVGVAVASGIQDAKTMASKAMMSFLVSMDNLFYARVPIS